MTHTPAPPFAHASGPRDARIAFVGEAWGEQEDLVGLPFIGSSGQELTRMMGEAGLERRHAFLTNVLALRPPGNKLEALCGTKAEVGGAAYTFPPITKGKYLRPEFLPELDRLREEIRQVRPNLVVALGNTACWGLLRATNIGTIRGAVASSIPGYGPLVAGSEASPRGVVKVLPTYHPAGVMRNWAWRPIVIADLMKAKRELEFPEIRRPFREVWINPTLEEIRTFIERHLRRAPIISVDIETGAKQIKCIGFAPSRALALVIPFVDLGHSSGSYWPSFSDERCAWELVKEILELPGVKLFQNGLYDLQYICRMGFKPSNCSEDTMLLHHSWFPELQKGLGFLGSIYSNEAAWKLMNRPSETKRDE